MDWNTFGQDRSFSQGGPLTSGADWAARVTGAEYNLAQQRGDYQTAAGTLGKLLGIFFASRS